MKGNTKKGVDFPFASGDACVQKPGGAARSDRARIAFKKRSSPEAFRLRSKEAPL